LKDQDRDVMFDLAGVWEVDGRRVVGGVVNVYADLYWMYASGACGLRMDLIVHTRSLTNTIGRAACKPTSLHVKYHDVRRTIL
jgi:hypothetical protein